MMIREESEHPLDKHIRDTLLPMQPAYKAKSWDELSRRLDDELLEEDVLFDRAVRSQLGRVGTHQQRRGWHRLVLQLELEHRRIRAVISCKSLEFIAALLLLLLISPRQGSTIREPLPATAGTSQRIADPVAAVTQNQSSQLPAANDISAAEVVDENSIAASRASYERGKSFALLAVPVRDLASGVSGHSGIGDRLSSLGLLAPETAAARHLLPARLLKPIAAPGIHMALPEPSVADMVVATTDEDRRERTKKTYLRMGPVGGPDYLRVITPPTTVGFDTLISLDRYAAGYHGGFSLGIEHGRWELETGLIYAVRRYAPIPVLYISGNLRTGFFAAGLHNFEFNTVNIPLNGRINLLMRNQWRVYALSGISLNMVLEANYYTAGEAAFSTSFLRPPSGNNGRNEPGLPGALEDKLTKGWLEGGRFLDNTTLYGNIGGGVERYMSPAWSLFSQTVYQHSLYDLHGGIGPYKDRIHALSVMLGVKVRL